MCSRTRRSDRRASTAHRRRAASAAPRGRAGSPRPLGASGGSQRRGPAAPRTARRSAAAALRAHPRGSPRTRGRLLPAPADPLRQVGARRAPRAVPSAGQLAEQPRLRLRRSAGSNALPPRGGDDSGRVRALAPASPGAQGAHPESQRGEEAGGPPSGKGRGEVCESELRAGTLRTLDPAQLRRRSWQFRGTWKPLVATGDGRSGVVTYTTTVGAAGGGVACPRFLWA